MHHALPGFDRALFLHETLVPRVRPGSVRVPVCATGAVVPWTTTASSALLPVPVAATEGLEPPATVVTATRSTAELLRKVRTGSRHAPRGTACRLSLCVVHRRPGGLQDGPGCATPAVGDPCRTRTCVRCVRGSRPTAGRTGRGCRAEGRGFEPQSFTTPSVFEAGPRQLRQPVSRPPLVRWAHESAGWELSLCRPTMGPRGRRGVVRPRSDDHAAIRPTCWRSLQLSRCYLGDTNQDICANESLSHSQGRRESKPVCGGFGGRPATGAPPLRVLSCVLRSLRKSKEPLPCGSGSSGHGPVKVQFRSSSTPPERARRRPLGRRRRAI